jgi:putative endopeptidase
MPTPRPFRLKLALLSTMALLVAGNANAGDHDHDHGHEDEYGTAHTSAPVSGGAAVNLSARSLGWWGFDTAGKDRATQPGVDFFRSMNGGWVNTTEIPADRGSQGMFAVLRDLSEARVKAIVEELAATPQSDPEAQKIADYYLTYLDEAAVEKAGLAPIQPDLDAIRTAPNKEALLTWAQKTGLGLGFGFFAGPDTRDTSINRLTVSQGGLGLGDRDLYLLDENNNPKVRAAYITMLEDYLRLAGNSDPKAAAETVFAYEKTLAGSFWTRAENRDPVKRENPRTLVALEKEAAGFPWKQSFEAAGVNLAAVKDLNLSQPSAAIAFAKTWSETPLETLKLYTEARLLAGSASLLPKPWQDAQFNFQKVRSGQLEQRPRWKRAIESTEGALGEAIGKRYVAQYFPPESKAQMLELVQNLRTAYAARIKTLDWMGPETKARALKKLDRQNVKIGYPDKWKDYSTLKIERGNLIGNARAVSLWDRADNLGRIGKPVDKGEWGMFPQTVNAYFSPLNNEIVFPAAILQPPFFDPKADPAVNYGGIGGVIGHEISHGFDDQGRNYDYDGSLRDWWKPADAEQFKARADILAAQYSAYEPLPGMKLNGRVSLGENIGDLGGLAIAYEAYKLSRKGVPAPILDGTTGDQRVFMGWAQIWRIKYREEALRATTTASPHSPGMYRVNGVVRNLDAWYKAFNVKPGDALYLSPENRVRIW